MISGLLSSLGGGGGGGGSGLVSLVAQAAASFADGGHVLGAGTSTSDSIPAFLSNGEFVVKGDQTKKYLPLLQAMNDGKLDHSHGMKVPGVARFADGGLVGSTVSGLTKAPNTATNINNNSTKIVNHWDTDAAMSEYLNTRSGERAILNIIQRNPKAV
jgi:hypothetical protein